MFPHHQNIDCLHNYSMLVKWVINDTKYMWFFDVSEKERRKIYNQFHEFFVDDDF